MERDNAWDKWLEEQLTLPRQKEVIGVFGILFVSSQGRIDFSSSPEVGRPLSCSAVHTPPDRFRSRLQ